MTAVTFNIDEVSEITDVKDFENRREPRSDTFFEFTIAEAKIDVAKINEEKGTGGYLYVSLRVQALDSATAPMFTKFVNLSVPVAYQGHTPPASAASIWGGTVNAIFGDEWDEIRTDSATNKKVYLKGGKVLDKAQLAAAFDARAKRAKTMEQAVIKNSAATLESFMNKHFFARVEPSKDGKYVNVTKITGLLTEGEKVCYDSKEAFSKGGVA